MVHCVRLPSRSRSKLRQWRRVSPRGVVLVFCKAEKGKGIGYALQNPSVTVPKQPTGLFGSLRSTPLTEQEQAAPMAQGVSSGSRSCILQSREGTGHRVCLAKSFGHRSQTTHRVVWFTAFDSPHEETIKKVQGCQGIPELFWWIRGESNPCPKTS